MQTISLGVLTVLVEDRFPNFSYNKCGVITKFFRWTIYQGTKYFDVMQIDVVRHNGLWKGSTAIGCNTWYAGGMVSKSDKGFPTLEECVEYHWRNILSRCERESSIKCSVNYKLSYLNKAKKTYSEWEKLSPSDKLSVFTEESL